MMKCSAALSFLLFTASLIKTAPQPPTTTAAQKKTEALAKVQRASSCNLLYRHVIGKLCMDWRDKHGLSALYDLLPAKTAAEREFRRKVSEDYKTTFGRIPEHMPLALPRFTKMKNQYRTLLRKYKALVKNKKCLSQVPCKDKTYQASERALNLSDALAIATKSMAELSTQLSRKVSDKELGGSIARLSSQLESLKPLFEKSKADIAASQGITQAKKAEIDQLKKNYEAQKNKIVEMYKEKNRVLTERLLDTSTKLSEATIKLQEKKSEPWGQDELLRITDQLSLVSNELMQQKNQTVHEKNSAHLAQQTLDQLKEALTLYVQSEQRFLQSYNNFKEIFTSIHDYSSASVAPIVNSLKEKWNNYTKAIGQLNAVLRKIGMSDVRIEPNECYSILAQGALLGAGSDEEPELMPA